MSSLKKLEVILKHLEPLLKAENDELKKDLGDEYTDDDKDLLIGMVDSYEKKLAKALKKEQKRVKKYVSEFVGKDVSLKALLAYLLTQMEEDNSLEGDIKTLTAVELTAALTTITPIIMDLIDKDVAFNTLSKRTLNWVDSWSEELGELMKINTAESVGNTLKYAIENGKSIDYVQRELEELPAFSRVRARTTAITEVLTAHSASHYESYLQSPAVTGKKWKHSGARKNNPRKWHVDYSSTIVDVDKPFTLDGEEGMFPRDPKFSARNRVRCHCAMGPVTDKSILGLSPKKKQKLHEDRMKELDK